MPEGHRDVTVQIEPILYVHYTKKLTTKWENGLKVIEKKRA